MRPRRKNRAWFLQSWLCTPSCKNVLNKTSFDEDAWVFLRYIGSLLYFGISLLAAFLNYKTAAEHLGLSQQDIDGWYVHIKGNFSTGKIC